MASKDDDEEKKPEAPAPKSKKKLFIIIGAVVAVVLIGVVAMLLLGGKEEPPPSEETEESHEEEPSLHTFQLDPFIVNLVGGRQFLKVGMLIEYDQSLLPHEKHAEGEEAPAEGGHGGGAAEALPGAPPPELEPRLPMIRDAVITLLTAKSVSDVISPEGKESLKEELVDALNDAVAMEDTPIVSVYFQEFIVQ
jgi:flagellar FliL protein